MSRRAILRAREAQEPTPAPTFTLPPEVTSSPRMPRGTCPKCFVHYGRAVAGHVKGCDGVAGHNPPAIMHPMINNGAPVQGSEAVQVRDLNNPLPMNAPSEADQVTLGNGAPEEPEVLKPLPQPMRPHYVERKPLPQRSLHR